MNFAYSVLGALENTNYMKIKDDDVKNLNIIAGATAAEEETPAEDAKD